MSPIKELNVSYDVLNEENTFSAGDTVSGTVTLTLCKVTEVKSLLVKVKGDADVRWSEGSGDHKKTYTAHNRYFKVKQFLVEENHDGTYLPQGIHHFKFRLQIPRGNMPPSFKGSHGKIVYMIEAKITRKWRMPSREQKELNFVSNSFPHHGQGMCRQAGSVDKDMGIFSKGRVKMSATVDRKVCSPGDTLSVAARISNSSSKKMRPKFNLYQKTVFRARSKKKTLELSVMKMVGDTIEPHSNDTASCQLRIPVTVIPTLQNCEIISVDYYLKVYLDISFNFDPEVVFPLIIVPSSFGNFHPGVAMGPYPAGAAGAQSYSNFPSPAFPPGAGSASAFPHPAAASPGAYGYSAPGPSQQANTARGGYSNQWPQQIPPYTYPSAPFPPSSALNQTPTAPPLSEEDEAQPPTAPPLSEEDEAPPPYSSLFPDSYDTFSDTGSDHQS